MSQREGLAGWVFYCVVATFAAQGAGTALGQAAKPVLGDDPVGAIISMTGHKGSSHHITFSPNGLYTLATGKATKMNH